MDKKTQELLDRTFNFGVAVLRYLGNLRKNLEFDVIRHQLAKAATSIGANYEEAQAAESKDDFAHKIGIVLKEIRETNYWLRVLKALDSGQHQTLDKLLVESEEFRRIFTSIRLTSQQRNAKRPMSR